ncbi:MAG: hypothetical protein ACREUA_01220 [Burkholderiales bacterium]
MKMAWMMAAAVVAMSAGDAVAGEPYIVDEVAVGNVDSVYVREPGGLFIDTALLKPKRDTVLWVDVHFSRPLSTGQQTSMAMLQEQAKATAGDRVEVKFAYQEDPTVNVVSGPSMASRLAVDKANNVRRSGAIAVNSTILEP